MMEKDKVDTNIVKEQFIAYAAEMITNERYQRYVEVVNERTRYMTLLMEDIFQPQNASAVLRSCECLGVQDIHVVENRNTFEVNPDVVLGSYKWLTVKRYNHAENNTLQAITNLKKQGYRIVATTPHKKSVVPDTFNLNKGKFALCMGTELTGLSETVLNNADEFLAVPMVGFTESFNVSVTAAIIMQAFVNRMRKEKVPYRLSEPEKQDLLVHWLLNNSQRKAELILADFCEQHKVLPSAIVNQ